MEQRKSSNKYNLNIKIYTVKNCIYCELAKNYFNEKNIKYKTIEIEKNINIFKILIKKYKQKTLPFIFINKKFIGGYNELKNYKFL